MDKCVQECEEFVKQDEQIQISFVTVRHSFCPSQGLSIINCELLQSKKKGLEKHPNIILVQMMEISYTVGSFIHLICLARLQTVTLVINGLFK